MLAPGRTNTALKLSTMDQTSMRWIPAFFGRARSKDTGWADSECQAVSPAPSQFDLPMLELSTFDGSPEQYRKFMDQLKNFTECKILDLEQGLFCPTHFRGENIDECLSFSAACWYIMVKVIPRLFQKGFQVCPKSY